MTAKKPPGEDLPPKPPAVWVYHPPSQRLQQVSRKSWDERSLDPRVEDGLTGWVLAGPDQAATGNAQKIAQQAWRAAE